METIQNRLLFKHSQTKTAMESDILENWQINMAILAEPSHLDALIVTF